MYIGIGIQVAHCSRGRPGSLWSATIGVVRVVSLVPSVTETLVAWGAPPVACTRFCEQPHLRHVGGTKDPDLAAIVDLRPDLVVVDEEENRRADHQALVDAGIPVHVLAIRSVADVGRQLPGLAESVGVRWVPPPLDLLQPVDSGLRAHAVVPIWRRPWMVLGRPTYGASLLERLGVDVLAPPGRGPYPQVDEHELLALGSVVGVTAGPAGAMAGPAAGCSEARSAPGGAHGEQVVGCVQSEEAGKPPCSQRRQRAVVLAPSEPYPFGVRHMPLLDPIGPVVFVDGKDLFWWGDRTSAALGRLRTRLHEALKAID